MLQKPWTYFNSMRLNNRLCAAYRFMNLMPSMLRSPSLNRAFMLAACCMVGSSAMFSLMNSFMRLASDTMHSSLIVSWRNLFALVLLLPFVMRAGIATMRTDRPFAHGWRALIGMLGMQLWTYCIVTMDLTVATALSFTAPLFTSLFAVVFLKEESSALRWLCLLAGFGGTLIILNPDLSAANMHGFVVLFTTSLWAVAGMVVKSLTRTEPALRIVFLMTVLMSVFSLPFAHHVWRLLTLHEAALIFCVAVTSLVAHVLMVKAYSLTSIVSLMPFDFSRLIFTSIFAYLFFAETLGSSTVMGSLIIIASAFIIARRDALHRTQKHTG